jgi:hypothetical protein
MKPILPLLAALICLNVAVHASPSLYFPYQNGVGSVATTELSPNADGLTPLAINYENVFDGYDSNSGSITYYSPAQTNLVTIPFSQMLSAEQIKALPQYAFGINNGALYKAEGMPDLFKKYSQNATNPASLVVTPFPYDNRLFVLVGSEPGIMGTDCIVTDITTKKDIIRFHLDDLPDASSFDAIKWISKNLILCILVTRNGNVNYFIDVQKRGFVKKDQFKEVDFYSLINGKLILYSDGPHDTLVSKECQF